MSFGRRLASSDKCMSWRRDGFVTYLDSSNKSFLFI
nr:MAG TPA: hypothetical protein [Caudoviricetes sp.]